MDLYVKAITNVPDLIIDFIEVKLKSGKTVSLNWDRSYVSQFESDNSIGISAEYCGLCFDEDPAGNLSELEDLSVTSVGLYAENYAFADIHITEMEFVDGEETLTFENAFKAEAVNCDG